MKKVLAWCKAHLAAVICGAVVLLVLPAAVVTSRLWNTSIKTKRQAELDADASKLKVNVGYAVPSIDPSVPAITLTSEPNAALTAFFAAERKKVQAQADGVIKRAEAFNRRGHKPLIDGLLPDARGPEAHSKAWALAEMLVGAPGKKSAYQKLFDDIGAGGPAEAEQLGVRITDTYQRLKNQVAGEGAAARALTPEEEKKILQTLKEMRLGEYQSRARSISTYGSAGAFAADAVAAVPKTPPTLTEVFTWTTNYWLLSDVLAFVNEANTKGGRRTTIDADDPAQSSLIKRIIEIRIATDPPWAPRQASSMGEEEGAESAPSAPAADAPFTPDFNYSVTGRVPGSGPWDVRSVYLRAVVSSARLPALFDAAARSNFVSIIDIDLDEVDVFGDLGKGYYYGSESVVMATLELEIVHLRSWTTPYMPAEVKKRLGIAEPAPAGEGEPKPEGDGPK